MKTNKRLLPQTLFYASLLQTTLFNSIAIAETKTANIAAFSLADNLQISNAWQAYQFDGIKPTQYKIIKEDENKVLLATSKNSASGLIHHIRFNPHETPYISWRWKALKTLDKSNAKKKSGDDYSLRLYVNFDYDIDDLPYSEQFKIRLYQKLKGDNTPLASLNYIWEKALAKETIIASPYTNRVQMLVLQNNQSTSGEWYFEQRNIVKDYQQAFGEPPKDVISIAIMSDSDNSNGSTQAIYSDITISKTPIKH